MENIDGGRRLDRTEADVETVREHQSLAGLEDLVQWRRDTAWAAWCPERPSMMTSAQAAASAGLLTVKPSFSALAREAAPFVEADADRDTAIAEIECVSMALWSRSQ